jgi:tetratricopeptide (TPR) repeat protein
MPVFTQGTGAEEKFSEIASGIPNFWWDGGWDKLSDLKTFISENPEEAALCAKAQYYIGCYYYSKQQYQKAIDEYRMIIKNYPSVPAECAKAQFEIGQITLNCLNKPEEAISEYRKVISKYPNDGVAPMCQLAIGRAYIKIKDKAHAKEELQKLIDSYAGAAQPKKQQAEAYVELGDMYVSDNQYKEALSCFKKAFLGCPPADSDMMVLIMDKIYESFRGLDDSVVRANQFIKYQKYGPAGKDKKPATEDDLTDPLAEF